MVLRRVVVLSRQTQLHQFARRIAEEVFVADDAAEATDILETVAPDLILLDDLLKPAEIDLLLLRTDKISRIASLVIGSNSNPPAWFEQLKKVTAPYYLSHPCDDNRLSEILNEIRFGQRSGDSSENCFFGDELAISVSMAGKSKAILNTLKMIRLVAGSNCNPVLITGETGTGKELAAKAVHTLRHPNEKFVAVNCAALTATLLESELFGHVKGCFTGADRDKTGLLELAGEGTIFLDEISEMPLELQAKLLRVLQEKTFRKVGGTADLTCKATIIASSNRNLREEVKANRFRRDLYYRLNIFPIAITALRSSDRKDDIRLLTEYFIKTSTVCPAKAGNITALTQMALEALEKHNWPGNVRELRNVIERAILLENTEKIGLSSIMIESEDPFETPGTGLTMTATSSIQNFSLEKAERELIARALQESGWQKTKAAALLGITRATLYAKVKQHNIQRGTYIPRPPEDESSNLAVSEAVYAG